MTTSEASQSGIIRISTGTADSDSGSIQLSSGDGQLSSGTVDIRTGNSVQPGALTFAVGASSSDLGSAVHIRAGASFGTGGNVKIHSGEGVLTSGEAHLFSTSSARSGRVVVSSGDGTHQSGDVILMSGSGEASGDIKISTSASEVASGSLELSAGGSQQKTRAGGSVHIHADASYGKGGDVVISAGESVSGQSGGSIVMKAGLSDGQSGVVSLATGDALGSKLSMSDSTMDMSIGRAGSRISLSVPLSEKSKRASSLELGFTRSDGMTKKVDLRMQSTVTSAGKDSSMVVASAPMHVTAVHYSSDMRIKKDIQPVNTESILQRIKKIPVRSYKYTDEWLQVRDDVPDVRVRGVIAQELAEVFPEYVTSIPEYTLDDKNFTINDFHQVDKTSLIVDLIAAMQALGERFVVEDNLEDNRSSEIRVVTAGSSDVPDSDVWGSGRILLQSGSSSDKSSGGIDIRTGDSTASSAGSIRIAGGVSGGGKGADISISAGDVRASSMYQGGQVDIVSGRGGAVLISSMSNQLQPSGDLRFTSGDSDSVAGSIVLSTGAGERSMVSLHSMSMKELKASSLQMGGDDANHFVLKSGVSAEGSGGTLSLGELKTVLSAGHSGSLALLGGQQGFAPVSSVHIGGTDSGYRIDVMSGGSDEISGDVQVHSTAAVSSGTGSSSDSAGDVLINGGNGGSRGGSILLSSGSGMSDIVVKNNMSDQGDSSILVQASKKLDLFSSSTSASYGIEIQTASRTLESGSIRLLSGSSTGRSGKVEIRVGEASQFGGDLELTSGDGFSQGGNLVLSSGKSNFKFSTGSSKSSSGSIFMSTGDTSDEESGSISLLPGASRNGIGGSVSVLTGLSDVSNSGSIVLNSARATIGSTSGEVMLSSGSSRGSSGGFHIGSGSGDYGSGHASITTGPSQYGSSGTVAIQGGDGAVASDIILSAGSSAGDKGGKAIFTAGAVRLLMAAEISR
eukprot:gene4089-2912_t